MANLIGEAHARTLDGIVVKALAVSWCLATDGTREPDLSDFLDADTTDDRITGTILRDLLAMREDLT